MAATTRTVVWQKLRYNMLWGTIIFMVGDYGAQLLTHFKLKRSTDFYVDNNRFVISSVLGAIWAGYANPSVYATVEFLLPGGGPSNFRRVLLKMCITCSILSTVGNYVTMIFRRFFKQLLETDSSVTQIGMDCVQSCNRDFVPVLKDDLKIWPLYDIMCYSVIPPKVRPITTALMASAWSMYMSIVSAKEEEVDPLAVSSVAT
uniref:Peroxisomal membrane protein MPV17 n=1 Tax=Ditylum brightwellii TaxID=49249 RepID=A0A6U3UQU7_9STRA|mmetsp:Transcript_6044/g.9177  ORF Transcript_6044/g.9177 Transcript_6044/m.9177 type:complete len:203 (+) Transcript_6044:677-1285(+)